MSFGLEGHKGSVEKTFAFAYFSWNRFILGNLKDKVTLNILMTSLGCNNYQTTILFCGDVFDFKERSILYESRNTTEDSPF
jgi:hypothetical protein